MQLFHIPQWLHSMSAKSIMIAKMESFTFMQEMGNPKYLMGSNYDTYNRRTASQYVGGSAPQNDV